MILTLSCVYYKTGKGEISTHFERKNLTLTNVERGQPQKTNNPCTTLIETLNTHSLPQKKNGYPRTGSRSQKQATIYYLRITLYVMLFTLSI